MVLATAQGRAEAREGADFFPLTVDVEERMYAAGKIPGGFFKREGRPTERAILTARMIDRPIRPLWPKGFRNEVQVICTVLSADMVTAHDILCINGASAALMLSPLPFLGPVGAVRVGLIDGQLTVNPTLRESEDNGELDLIVVGTKDGLTMVEAGANEVPEEKILEALELAHGEIVKLCEAQEDLRRQAGKPKWLDLDLLAELERDHGHAIWERIQQAGIKESSTAVEELLAELAPPITMESTDDDIQRQIQVKSALALLLEKQRAVAVEGPVREQFGDELKALTDAEQDSKALKSAKRQLLFDRIVEEVELPFPVGRRHGRSRERRAAAQSKDSQTKSQIKKACESIYKDLVRQKIAVDKRRPDGRGAEEIRPIEVEVGDQPAHPRLRPVHARPDADPLVAHARHREGGAAHRRPLPRGGAPLHAPLQLPALLGRGDGLHARPEAARHRPRCARAAGARGGHPDPRGLPVHDPDRLGDARVERLVVDGLGLRLDAVAHGRRRADQGARLGHRHGPREGGRRLRHPDRHPGRGGPPRRHGLQGRRLPQRDHRAPDGHQDHRRHPADHAGRARAGEAGARVHPREDARGHPGVALRALRQRAADHDDQDRSGEDRHGHRQGRRDDPRPRVRLRGADRHRGGRHDPRSTPPRARRPRRRSPRSSRSRRSPRSATRSPARS